MSVPMQPGASIFGLEKIIRFFPKADPQIVSALSAHTQTLTRYLSQIHDLTPKETSETIDIFFLGTGNTAHHARVA